LLFVLNALNRGDFGHLLGAHAAELLQKSQKKETLAALGDVLRQKEAMLSDPVAGHWQSWPFPVHDGQQFRFLDLCVRRDGDGDRQAEGVSKAARKTRFLIALTLSRLGRLQIDGLSQSKRLDLILRAEKSLNETLKKELTGLYLSTLEATGLTGSLAFQSGLAHWVYLGAGKTGAMRLTT
jgi:hypothetical protein